MAWVIAKVRQPEVSTADDVHLIHEKMLRLGEVAALPNSQRVSRKMNKCRNMLIDSSKKIVIKMFP